MSNHPAWYWAGYLSHRDAQAAGWRPIGYEHSLLWAQTTEDDWAAVQRDMLAMRELVNTSAPPEQPSMQVPSPSRTPTAHQSIIEAYHSR